MSTEKKRFSARVKRQTLDTLDDEADKRGLNRSQAIDRIVEEGRLAVEEDEKAEGNSAVESEIPLAAGFWFVLVGSVLAALSIVAVVAWALTPLPVTPSFVLALAVATIVVNAAAIIRAKHPATDGGGG